MGPPASGALGAPARAAEIDRSRASLDSASVPAKRMARPVRASGLCPLAWCSFGVATTITGRGRIDQAARLGRLTRRSSPIGAMLSRVM